MHSILFALASLPFVTALPGQDPAPLEPAPAAAARRFPEAGDLDKIAWERPFARAQELARERNRVLLVKPILGGSNTPRPGGVACGGKDDCEGSW
jgi:hypothetical protein